MEHSQVPMAMIEPATMVSEWIIVLPLVLALLGAATLLMMRRSDRPAQLFSLLVAAAIGACEVGLLARVYADGPVSMTMGKWLPPFGISFTVDVFGAGFALAATLVTFAVLLYTTGKGGRREAGFLSMTLLLLAGVTGSFLTGDLFNLYVWFEVMLIASLGLMVLGGSPLQLDAAVKYGFLNFLATAIFLLALGLLYGALGTLNMADILRVAPEANPAAMAGVGALFLLAFGMKAAAFPLQGWLPASYHAPAAAVSALMAGLLTKVGVYALLRTMVVILPGAGETMKPVLAAAAFATLVIAPLGAIADTNLRRAIGFLVIGGTGSVLAGLTLPSELGLGGASLYILHAMLTMTALYLVAGLVEHRTGAFDTRQMGGLYASSAPLSIMFLVLILAAAGVPPFLGFWPKLLLLQAGVEQGGWTSGLLVAALVLNAILTLIAGSRLWAHIFWRTPASPLPSSTQHMGPIGATALLVTIVLLAGLWPNALFEALDSGTPDLLDPSRYSAAVGLAEGSR
jgi:multicomponent Na+:H+ antiporter subunit D